MFYAGHGIEVDKRNFLIPVDARLVSDGDVVFEAVSLDLVLQAVEGASNFRLINPGCLSRQSVCGGDAACGRDALDRAGSGER